MRYIWKMRDEETGEVRKGWAPMNGKELSEVRDFWVRGYASRGHVRYEAFYGKDSDVNESYLNRFTLMSLNLWTANGFV